MTNITYTQHMAIQDQEKRKKEIKSMLKLSEKQQEVYDIICKYKQIVRWGECYWTYKNCGTHTLKYRNEVFDMPDWKCQTNTLRALTKKNLILLNEEKDIATIL